MECVGRITYNGSMGGSASDSGDTGIGVSGTQGHSASHMLDPWGQIVERWIQQSTWIYISEPSDYTIECTVKGLVLSGSAWGREWERRKAFLFTGDYDDPDNRQVLTECTYYNGGSNAKTFCDLKYAPASFTFVADRGTTRASEYYYDVPTKYKACPSFGVANEELFSDGWGFYDGAGTVEVRCDVTPKITWTKTNTRSQARASTDSPSSGGIDTPVLWTNADESASDHVSHYSIRGFDAPSQTLEDVNGALGYCGVGGREAGGHNLQSCQAAQELVLTAPEEVTAVVEEEVRNCGLQSPSAGEGPCFLVVDTVRSVPGTATKAVNDLLAQCGLNPLATASQSMVNCSDIITAVEGLPGVVARTVNDLFEQCGLNAPLAASAQSAISCSDLIAGVEGLPGAVVQAVNDLFEQCGLNAPFVAGAQSTCSDLIGTIDGLPQAIVDAVIGLIGPCIQYQASQAQQSASIDCDQVLNSVGEAVDLAVGLAIQVLEECLGSTTARATATAGLQTTAAQIDCGQVIGAVGNAAGDALDLVVEALQGCLQANAAAAALPEVLRVTSAQIDCGQVIDLVRQAISPETCPVPPRLAAECPSLD